MDNPTPPVARPGLPWENRAKLGLLAATVDTVKGVLLDPAAAFKTMRLSGGLGDPLLFALLLGTLGGLAGLLWQTLLTMLAPALSGASSELLESAVTLVVLAVVMPLIVIFYLFVVAAVVHLMLLIVGGSSAGFEGTFRVIAFAYGSTAVLQLVPIFGSFAALVWVLVASVFGLCEAHATSGVKASVAVLLPLGLCCLCVCGGVAAAIAFFGLATGMK